MDDFLLKLLASIAGAAFVGAFGALYVYYQRLFDNATKTDVDKAAYAEFRQRFELGGMWKELYELWLGRALDRLDRFFGDFGQASPRFVLRLFGLEDRPAPIWTAAAFDKCLLLALVYPVFSVVVIWVVSGDVGPAERALVLFEKIQWFHRLLFLLPVTPYAVFWYLQHQ